MNLIIGEGLTELSIAYHYLKTQIKEIDYEKDELKNIKQQPVNIHNKIYFSNILGISKLSAFISSFIKSKEFDKFENIFFIVDADDSYNNRKDSMDNFINEIKKSSSANVEYFILPDNCNCGMCEDLLLQSASRPGIAKEIVENIFPTIKDHPESDISNIPKAKFMIYAATQTPVKKDAHLMIQQAAKLINFDHDALKDLKEFIYKAL